MELTMKNTYPISALFALACLPLCSHQARSTETFSLSPPPAISTNDSAGVNIISGLPTFSQTDLKIGNGANQLTHSIATYDSIFFGFIDSYDYKVWPSQWGRRNVHVGLQSKVFAPNTYGTADDGYSPLDEDGSKLELLNDNTYRFTDRNGVIWDKESIKYPNGFTIYKGLYGLTTNTGLQFKYQYIFKNASSYTGNSYEVNNLSDKLLDDSYPKEIVALNNTEEFCDNDIAFCNVEGQWPKVSYNFPYARDILHKYGPGNQQGDGLFTVTDALGRKTTYKHELFKDENPCQERYGGAFSSGVSNPEYKTRITQVRSEDPNILDKDYSYDHHTQVFSTSCGQGCFQQECVVRFSLIDEVDIRGKKWLYNLDQAESEYLQLGASDTYKGRTDIRMSKYGTDFVKGLIRLPFGNSVTYNIHHKNTVEHAIQNGLKTKYVYDARSNITEIRYYTLNQSSFVSEKADYDLVCDNIKKCNKPNWTEDKNGNRTDYTYHPESGQVATITKPANEKNIRPQTRYNYELMYATYKAKAGLEVSPDGIWLLDTESYCANSTYNGSTCSGGDEVKVTYQYSAGNLFTIGKLVQADGKSLRTCYRYDNYGNQIGETSPKANLTTCAY